MWEGVPDDLTAALQIDGFTYFFKGDHYFRFNDRTFSIDKANPPFPRPFAYWWFGCRDAPKTLDNVMEDEYNEEVGEEYDEEMYTDDGDEQINDTAESSSGKVITPLLASLWLVCISLYL